MRARAVLGVGGLLLAFGCQGNVGFSGRDEGYSGTSPSRRNPPRAAEECGNGYDDNGDDRVDEGCACTPGQTQSCFSGDSTARQKGICVDGVQTCEMVFEFPQWGPCLGEIVPISEIGGNSADDDCDGDTDEGGDFPGAGTEAPCTPAELETCDNGSDDDCDGLTDCSDPQCGGSCTGGDYPDRPGEPPLCQEGSVCVPGMPRWCDTPAYCAWGKQICQPDGQWGECIEVSERPGTCAGRWYDTDCCLAAEQCCQDFPRGYGSAGNCGGVTCE